MLSPRASHKENSSFSRRFNKIQLVPFFKFYHLCVERYKHAEKDDIIRYLFYFKSDVRLKDIFIDTIVCLQFKKKLISIEIFFDFILKILTCIFE